MTFLSRRWRCCGSLLALLGLLLAALPMELTMRPAAAAASDSTALSGVEPLASVQGSGTFPPCHEASVDVGGDADAVPATPDPMPAGDCADLHGGAAGCHCVPVLGGPQTEPLRLAPLAASGPVPNLLVSLPPPPPRFALRPPIGAVA